MPVPPSEPSPRTVDLNGTPGPLRHYVAALVDGHIVLTHRRDGPVLHVSEDTFRRRLAARTEPADAAALEVLRGLVPAMCESCGHVLLAGGAGLCVTCRASQIEDLLRVINRH